MKSNVEFRIANQEGGTHNGYITCLSFYKLSALFLLGPLLFHIGSIAALAPSPLQKMEGLPSGRITFSCGARGEARGQGNVFP